MSKRSARLRAKAAKRRKLAHASDKKESSENNSKIMENSEELTTIDLLPVEVRRNRKKKN